LSSLLVFTTLIAVGLGVVLMPARTVEKTLSSRQTCKAIIYRRLAPNELGLEYEVVVYLDGLEIERFSQHPEDMNPNTFEFGREEPDGVRYRYGRGIFSYSRFLETR